MTSPTQRKRARNWPIIASVAAVVLVLGLGLLILLRGNGALEVDAEWMAEIVEHRSPWWEAPSLLMNFLGGGWFSVYAVPLTGAVILCLLRRYVAALYFLLAVVASAACVQLLKVVFDRPRPAGILISIDSGAFPSGHVANAATLAVAVGIIVWRGWVWFAGATYTVLMLLSRTYLGAHWFSDTVGGLLLGVAVAVILWGPFSRRMLVEAEAQPR